MSGKTVTRAQLSEAVYQIVGLSRNESAELVESVLEEISNALIRGEAVKISSFASFSIRHKGRRIGRNPKTGEEVPILSRMALRFRASQVLKSRINEVLSRKGERGMSLIGRRVGEQRMDDFVYVSKVAQELGTTAQTIKRWLKNKLVAGVIWGRDRRGSIIVHKDSVRLLQTHLAGVAIRANLDVREKSVTGSHIVIGVGGATYARVRVFYGTDRNRTSNIAPGQFFGSGRGPLQLGVLEVSIPRDHRMGDLESPAWWKLEFREDPKKHVVLLNIFQLNDKKFDTLLRLTVEQSTGKEAFVFIHGFNTTFEDAARRTAQLAYDLNFQGAPILYSWPSEGELQKYMVDETDVEWTVPDLVTFLGAITAKSGARTVHLIAHSMGNRALIKALNSFIDQRREVEGPAFNQVALAAPDIDAEVFKQLAQHIVTHSERTTMYASSFDKALVASRKFHGYARAGESGDKIVIMPGIDTIDSSAVDTNLVGHSYYAENKSILSDIFALLRHGHPPDQRFGLHQRFQNSNQYWLFQP